MNPQFIQGTILVHIELFGNVHWSKTFNVKLVKLTLRCWSKGLNASLRLTARESVVTVISSDCPLTALFVGK